MARFTYDLNPVQSIVAGAIGEPGRRTFFLQGRAGRQVVNLMLEKQEVSSLATALLQLLQEVEERYPDLPPAINQSRKLTLEPVSEPDFRVAQMSVGYDEAKDMVWIIAKALVMNDAGQVVDPERDDVPAARFVATRNQIRALSEHASDVVLAGRPVCPLCGRPIDRGGHFCPRADGNAVPIVF
jgi:uncharacterized repeat protein (TIGR03847 family)